MVFFVGAGPGAVDLITVRGRELLRRADVIIYAGSLVNPALLWEKPTSCAVYDSAGMTLEQVISAIISHHEENSIIVRLHTGDPSMYGAIREQMVCLDAKKIPYEVVPGVSSVFGAAAALCAEFTLPAISQTLILTRMEGRTPVPAREDIAKLAAIGASMAVFLSAGKAKELSEKLLKGSFTVDTPVAIVYKATWNDERIVRTTVGKLPRAALESGITKTALFLIGDFLGEDFERSKLYDPAFAHGFRDAVGTQ